jgi:hypothetical protein
MQQNDTWHFWAKNTDNMSSNYKYHFSCLEDILKHYNEKFPGRFTRVRIFSDGCPEQYKSKYFVEELTHMCQRCGWIAEFVHTYAPTAGFKCCCDAAGNDTKSFMRKAEQAGKVRASDAFKVFRFLDKHMPQPAPATVYDAQFRLTNRYHRYVVPAEYEAEKTDQKDYNQYKRDSKVVVVQEYGDRNQKAIDNMRKVYQLRVTRSDQHSTSTVRKVYYRRWTCWCQWCAQYTWDRCVLNNTWTEVNIGKKSSSSSSSSSNRIDPVG